MNKKNKKNDLQIINAIQKARQKNNHNWMSILKIAISSAPNETRKVLKKINYYDKKISLLINKFSR